MLTKKYKIRKLYCEEKMSLSSGCDTQSELLRKQEVGNKKGKYGLYFYGLYFDGIDDVDDEEHISHFDAFLGHSQYLAFSLDDGLNDKG